MGKSAKPDTWMPLFIGDYLKDTARLSTEQHGAYLLLIMDYWTNGPPADDDEELAAITRLDIKSWRRHRPKLERFFAIENGAWMHKRIDAELMAAQGKADKAAERAAAAANARWSKDTPKQSPPDPPSSPSSNASGNARSMLEECPSPSPSEDKGPIGPVGSAWVSKSDVDAIWARTPAKGRERSSRRDVERALKAAVGRGHSVGEVTAALEAYYASPSATKDGGEYARGAHRMIENDRWQEFAASAPLATAPGPSVERQRAWMQDWRESPHTWRIGDRGPPPGCDGCRIDPDIQREAGVEPYTGGDLLPFPKRGAA